MEALNMFGGKAKSRSRRSSSSSRKKEVVGSRAQVMNGTADKTSGGLYKKDLKHNKYRRIVSKKASAEAKKRNNLGDCKVPEGSKGFTLVKKGCSKTRSSSRRRKQSGGKSRRRSRRH
jgi:hypothetical protein